MGLTGRVFHFVQFFLYCELLVFYAYAFQVSQSLTHSQKANTYTHSREICSEPTGDSGHLFISDSNWHLLNVFTVPEHPIISGFSCLRAGLIPRHTRNHLTHANFCLFPVSDCIGTLPDVHNVTNYLSGSRWRLTAKLLARRDHYGPVSLA